MCDLKAEINLCTPKTLRVSRARRGGEADFSAALPNFFSTFFDLPLGIHIAICYNI